jgi:hypothetical protein
MELAHPRRPQIRMDHAQDTNRDMDGVNAMNARIETPKTGLDLLRAPFPAHQISKLPKPTKKQTDDVRADFKKGIRCKICGGWHHPDVVHLDYVGHAALTDRLLDCDPGWNWEPVAFTDRGTPAIDENGGMWIKLTVCGVTRYGYGHPDGKKGGDAIKELIGDALRNAAMRFGAALDLWHKGDLHALDDADAPTGSQPQERQQQRPRDDGPDPVQIAIDSLSAAETVDALAAIWGDLPNSIKASPAVIAAKNKRKDALKDDAKAEASPLITDDKIPY